ncbi:MAG TPA: SDR family NAD(P)-dependent oxidoreductase, partial [Vicinamibacterales bacterium]|nr:SDR family NAD(P)-dependent oxidoreductase [Vicinamibacterales bacterium]
PGDGALAGGPDGSGSGGSLLETLAALWVRGVAVDWEAVHRDQGHQRVTLPSYPWQRSRHWLEPSPGGLLPVAPPSSQEDGMTVRLLSSAVRRPETEFEARLDAAEPLIAQHRVRGRAIVPAAAFLELALASARASGRGQASVLEHVRFLKPLALSGPSAMVRLVLTPTDEHAATFEIFAASDERSQTGWTLHVVGQVRAQRPPVNAAFDLGAARRRLSRRVDAEQLYETLASTGVELGPRYRRFDEILLGDDEALARLGQPSQPGWHLDPGLVDGCTILRLPLEGAVDGLRMTSDIGMLAIHRNPAEAVWVHVSRDSEPGTAAINLLDANGLPTVAVEGHRLGSAELPDHDVGCDPLPLYRLAWAPAAEASPNLPTLDELATALRPLVAARFNEDDVRGFVKAEAELESASADFALAALGQLDGGVDLPDRVSTETLAATVGVVQDRRRLFRRILEMVAEVGQLGGDDEQWTWPPPAVTGDPEARLRALAARSPEVSAECQILARCAGRLPDLLRGRGEPLSLLFPPADPAGSGPTARSAETLYRDSTLARAMNSVLGEAIARLASGWPTDRPVRVLEIGAGTGATTTVALAALPDDAEYWFTDVSALFVQQARNRLVDDRLRFATLDIECPARDQGIDEQRFDLVVASNVLHATRLLDDTVDHAGRLLAPGGVLMLLEGTARRRWVDLIFGLTDGWWRFADATLRPTHPLMSSEAWLTLLGRHGFSQVMSLPDGRDAATVSQTLLVARRATAGVGPIGRWLVSGDPGPERSGIVETLLAEGAEVATVDAAPGPDATSRRVSESAEGWEADVRRFVMARRADVCGIVSLCGPGEEVGEGRSGARARAAEEDARVSADAICATQRAVALTRLLQTVHAEGGSPRVWFVTRDAQPVGRATMTGLAAAPVWGIAKTLAVETPEICGGVVDLGPGDVTTGMTSLARRFCAGAALEDERAVRDGGPFVPSLESERDGIRPPPAPLEGTCLITGGLGAFGLAIAERMGRRGVAALCLVGRRGAQTAEARRRVAALEAQGLLVRVECLDVADESAVRDLLASIDAGPHPLRGVIHAAGVTGMELLRETTPDTVARIARPKIEGAWALHRATRDRDLRFFVCLSSMVSVWGARGQAPYVAANHFLDALAHFRRRLGLPAMTINWGPLSGGGMVPDDIVENLARIGVTTTPIGRAVETLDRLLDGPLVQPVAVEIDWNRFAAARATRRRTTMFDQVRSSGRAPIVNGPSASGREAVLRAVSGERRTVVLDQLSALLGRVIPLGEEIDTTAGLFDLGLDSLGSMEFSRLLELTFGFAVPQTLLFNHGTLDAVATAVMERLESGTTEPGQGAASVDLTARAVDAVSAVGESRELDTLDEAEVEALLRRRLEEIG